MSRASNKNEKKHRKLVGISVILAFLVILLYIIVSYSGHWLVTDDEFNHVKWLVVLDGQSADMERNDFAAQLLKENKVDSILILGRRTLRNRSNAEFYVDDFMQLGNFDSNAVFLGFHDDASTIGEAFTVIPWLKAHKADTVLLLTSAPATRRVKRIFTKLSGESPVYLTADMHHYQFNADSWHTNRESRKFWLREWSAYAISFVDLWSSGVLTAKDSAYFKPIVSVKEFEQQKNPIVDLQSLLPKTQAKNKVPVPADTSASNTVPKDSLPAAK